MLSLVLWDVDGTLVDSQAHIVGAMEQAFAVQGLAAPARQDILGIVGLSLPEAMARLAPGADTARLVADYKQAFQDLRSVLGRDGAPLYPGIRAVLDGLNVREDVVQGVATGKSRRGLDHVIELHELGRMFVTRQDADGHPSKPHPSMGLTAMAEAGAEQGVMIGDTTFDMEMGRAAGLRTIGVAWGYHPVAALAPFADEIATEVAQLPDLIEKALKL
ncbi:MAG: HAD-IA family hydrolase [Shimia sp.]